MKVFAAAVLVIFISQVTFAQETTREQKFQQIKELSGQIDKVIENLLLPSPVDLKAAELEGVKAFRLMPREVFDRVIARPQGGGAYYSFTTGSHDYQRTAQISLEQKYLSTGFSGANYGLMGDLGNIPLSEVVAETPEIGFLLKYNAPGNILDARVEQRRSDNYDTGAFILRRRFPVKIGNTFVLRTITFSGADVLVAFKVMRQDTDGSVIIFWKQLADFGVPKLDPNIREN